jgi:hypothetical protein
MCLQFLVIALALSSAFGQLASPSSSHSTVPQYQFPQFLTKDIPEYAKDLCSFNLRSAHMNDTKLQSLQEQRDNSSLCMSSRIWIWESIADIHVQQVLEIQRNAYNRIAELDFEHALKILKAKLQNQKLKLQKKFDAALQMERNERINQVQIAQLSCKKEELFDGSMLIYGFLSLVSIFALEISKAVGRMFFNSKSDQEVSEIIDRELIAKRTRKNLEKDPSMKLDDQYILSWVRIRLIQKMQNISVYFKDTLANGLCFYYSLRQQGIADPRSRLIQFLNDAKNLDKVNWWLGISGYRKDKVIEILKTDPRKIDPEEAQKIWADEFILILSSLVFKLKIFIFHQYSKNITTPHTTVQDYFSNLQFEQTVWLYHHKYGRADIISKKSANKDSDKAIEKTENHYGVLAFFDSKTNKVIQDSEIESIVDQLNRAANENQ